VGYMINAHEQREMEPLIALLMDLPNQTWRDVMTQVKQNIEILNVVSIIHKIANILKTNVAACSTIGPGYITQLAKIYLDTLNICKYYSEQISKAIAQMGESATRANNVKEMRTVKRETFKFITTYIGVATDIDMIVQNILPPLLPYVLEDYKMGVPGARDHEVLALMEKIVSKCKERVTAEIPTMFASVFECTLDMIRTNFEDYPEIRQEFFKFLRSVNQYCFDAFMRMPPDVFKLIIDAILWGTKHSIRTVSETALETLREILEKVLTNPSLANPFAQVYYLRLLEEIFFVLTDTLHKTGFKIQARVLQILINSTELNMITVPLWDPTKVTYANMNNLVFIREHLMLLLSNAFKNLSPSEINDFVNGLFEFGNKEPHIFHNHLRDFLVKMKEFSEGDNNTYLYRTEQEAIARQTFQEQMQIPGLVGPHDPRRTDRTMID